MKLIETKKLDKNMVEFTIEVSGEDFEKAQETAYRKNVGKISIPGFRKGKAPRKMIEKMYGEGFFYEDAINASYPSAYSQAVSESGLEPVDKAEIDVENVSNEGYTFKAKFTAKPEIEVANYKGISAAKPAVSVTKKDIDEEINRMAQRSARLVSVDRESKLDDTLVFDFEGFVDDVAFEGGKAEKYSLKLGTGQFIPGFEEQLVGHKAGEELDVSVTFPTEYQSTELAGKPAVFKCKIHEVKATELPVIDDEFAKDVSEFDTLADLKADIEKKLLESREKNAQADYEDALIDAVIEGIKGEIPEVMYENEVDNIAQDFEYRLSGQGMNLQTYLQYSGMTMDGFRKTFRPQAEKRVKIRLALEKIAKLENLSVSDEELASEYENMAKRYDMTASDVKKYVDDRMLRLDMLVDKARQVVMDNAKQKVTPKSSAKASEDKKPKEAKSAEKKPAVKKTATTPKATAKKSTSTKTKE